MEEKKQITPHEALAAAPNPHEALARPDVYAEWYKGARLEALSFNAYYSKDGKDVEGRLIDAEDHDA